MDPHVVANIAQLQDREKQLHNDYSSLGTPVLKQQSLENMRQLTKTRIELFNSLKAQYTTDVLESNDLLKDNIATLKIVENELDAAKDRKEVMDQRLTDKMRQVEFSTYSSQKYMAYNKFLGLIIKWGVIIAIVLYISKRSLIPEEYITPDNSNTFFLVLTTMIGFYGLYQILIHLYDLTLRNNMNFNEYDFTADYDRNGIVKHSPKLSQSESEFEKMAKSLNLGCVDSECCADGTLYNSLKKQCMPAIKKHHENTKNASLTKGAMGSHDAQTRHPSNSHQVEGFSHINVPFSSV
tara:strand:+ start:263 stop:1147 length:885 start_codon:yes stop_codon:yes gene_type:complete